MKAPASLQGRLLALVLGLVLLLWGAASVLTWFDARHELDELLDSHLAQAAALLVVQQSGLEADHVVDAPILHHYAPRVAFQVFHEGKLAMRSANAPAWFSAQGADQFESGFHTVRVDKREWRVFAARGIGRDVRVYVGEQADARDEILGAVLLGTLWPMLVALPLVALAIWWAVAHGLAPMRQLGATLAARPANELAPVAVAEAPAEMQPLIAALNGLFTRIAVLLETERRFTADAAHELRTPIAAIRAQAQVALGAADDTGRRQALVHTLQGCDRATRLVEQMLTLSRLEADSAGVRRAVDLPGLLRATVAEIAPRAIEKQQEIAVEAAPELAVQGDETLLRVLVRNLVDNAVRYSPKGARIAVQAAEAYGRPVLTVEDSGPGLAEDDMSRLGERFFRVPGNAESGSGLGWSIARRIAAAHRAQISATRSGALGGLAVRVVF